MVRRLPWTPPSGFMSRSASSVGHTKQTGPSRAQRSWEKGIGFACASTGPTPDAAGPFRPRAPGCTGRPPRAWSSVLLASPRALLLSTPPGASRPPGSGSRRCRSNWRRAPPGVPSSARGGTGSSPRCADPPGTAPLRAAGPRRRGATPRWSQARGPSPCRCPRLLCPPDPRASPFLTGPPPHPPRGRSPPVNSPPRPPLGHRFNGPRRRRSSPGRSRASRTRKSGRACPWC
mmetsp:Transcript_6417/g.14772  ORF Transcript_6417/g.14772 Transcript_6417/m.14772 type:complete len:232 (-) Transcript_6417:952-1647(-)